MGTVSLPSAKIVALSHRKRKDGTVPLHLRVIHERKKKEYSLKIYVSKAEFNFTSIRYKKSSGNIKLNAIEEKALQVIDALPYFTFTAFEEKFFGENTTGYTVLEFLELIRQDNYSRGKQRNGDMYKNVIDIFNNYPKTKYIKFQDITPAYLTKLETHLRKTNGTTSISIYMRTLRAAYNLAIGKKFNLIPGDLYPFWNANNKGYGTDGYKIKNKKTKSKLALSKADMLRIINYKTDDNRLKDSLNYWTFSYLCRGMNFKDICHLKRSNIIGNRIVFVRLKTEETNTEEKEMSIKITNRIQQILDQYAGNDPFLFPILEPNLSDETIKHRMNGKTKKINKDIRAIAKELEIERYEDIVFMVARHTYASILTHSGTNLVEISESMGHSSITTTQNYIHSLVDRLDKNDAQLL